MAIAISPVPFISPFNRPAPKREHGTTVRSQPQPPPAGIKAPPKVKHAHEEEGASGDKQVDAYMYALAAMIEESGGDSEKFLTRIKDLMHFGEGTEGAEELVTTAEVQSYEAASVAYAQNGSGFAFYGSYEASLSGRFTQQVAGEDGSTQTLHISFEVKVQVEVAVSVSQEKMTDPLAFDLDGDEGISLAEAFSFDIDGDGTQDLVPFASGSDVFLALDRNGDGAINDGRELFGDQHGAANGFEELKRWDADANGIIDRNDAIYEQLKGVSGGKNGALAVYSLAQLSIESISLSYENISRQGDANSVMSQQGSCTTTGGQTKAAYDLLLPRLNEKV